eukprot:4669073-Pyramimonas_sp.AAC.1
MEEHALAIRDDARSVEVCAKSKMSERRPASRQHTRRYLSRVAAASALSEIAAEAIAVETKSVMKQKRA